MNAHLTKVFSVLFILISSMQVLHAQCDISFSPDMVSDTAVCESGDDLEIEAIVDGPATTFEWVAPDNSFIGGTNTFSGSIAIANPVNPTTNYTVTVTSSSGCSIQKVIRVTVTGVPNAAFTFDADSICLGIESPVTPSALDPNYAYLWEVNSGFANFDDSLAQIPNMVAFDAGPIEVQLTVIDTRADDCEAVTTGTIDAEFAEKPLVRIIENFEQPICPGVDAEFLVGTIDPKYTGISYQWYKNDLPITAANSTVLRLDDLVDGDEIQIEVRNFNGCVFPKNIRSEKSIISVVDTSVDVLPTVTISAAYQTDATTAVVCPTKLTHFYAEPTNGGVSPTYEWYVNSVLVPSQTTSTFEFAAVAGDEIRARMNSKSSCLTTTIKKSNFSNPIFVTEASGPLANYIEISANTATQFCQNGGGRLELEIDSVAPNIPGQSYDWTAAGIAQTTNGKSVVYDLPANFTAPSNARATFTITDDNYTCFIPATAVNSNQVQLTKLPALGLTISSDVDFSDAQCANQIVNLSTTVTNGQVGANYSYIWYYDNQVIPFENGPSLILGSLDQDALIFAAVRQDVNCAVDPVYYSKTKQVRVGDVNPLPEVELISDLPDRILCENGDPLMLYGSFIGTYDDDGNPEFAYEDIYSQIRDVNLPNLVDNSGNGIIDTDNLTIDENDDPGEEIIDTLIFDQAQVNIDASDTLRFNVTTGADIEPNLILGKNILIDAVKIRFVETTNLRQIDNVRFRLRSPSGTEIVLLDAVNCFDSEIQTDIRPGKQLFPKTCGYFPVEFGVEDLDFYNENNERAIGNWTIYIDNPADQSKAAIGVLEYISIEFLVVDAEYDPTTGDYTHITDPNGDNSGEGDVLAGTVVRDTILYFNTDPNTGCTNSDTIIFKVVDIPKAFAGDFQQYDFVNQTLGPVGNILDTCANTVVRIGGGETTLTPNVDSTTAVEGTPPYSYAWEANPSENVTIFSKTAPSTDVLIKEGSTTLSLTITDFNGCESDPVDVTLNALTLEILNSEKLACQGLTRNLEGTADFGTPFGAAGYVYRWEPAELVFDPDTSSTDFIVEDPIKYTLSVSDARGCADQGTINVTPLSTPTVDAGPAKIGYCDGDSAQIGGSPAFVSGTAPFNISWFPRSGLSADSISNPFASPGADLLYRLVVEDVNGCIGRDSILVEFFSLPTAEAGPGQVTLCAGSNVKLGGSPVANGGLPPYRYRWSPGVDLSSAVVANPFASPTVNRSYTLTVIDANNCEANDSIRVNTNNLLIDAGEDKIICEGESVEIGSPNLVLNGVGPFNYAWVPGNSLTDSKLNNPTANPTGTVTYTVTVRDALGCESVDFVTVSISEPPVADAGDNVVICKGDSLDIGSTRGAIGGIPPYRFNWAPTTGLDTNVVQNPKAGPKATQVYSLLVRDSLGCVSEIDEVLVTVAPELRSDAGDDQKVCVGLTGLLGGKPVASGGTPPYNYNWSPNQGLSNFQTASPTVVATDSLVVYTLTVTDGIGCKSIDSVNVLSNPQPVVDAGLNGKRCLNTGYLLGGNPTATNGTPPYVYTWSPTNSLINPNSANPTAEPEVVTNYTVVVTDSRGCTATDEIRLTPVAFPTADAGPNGQVCLETGIVLGGSTVATGGNPPYNYRWQPEVLFEDPFVSRPTAFPVEPTEFTLTVVDQNNCFGTSTAGVFVNFPVDADFTVTSENTLTITFDAVNTSLDDSQYSWNFGDGFSDVGASVTHTYTTRSIFDVCLTTRTDEGCVETQCDRVNLFTVDTDDMSNSMEFSLYPNPANNLINLSWNNISDLQSIQILDMNAKPVKQISNSEVSAETQIDISQLANGVYHIIWKSENGIIHKEHFVKQ